MTSPIPALRPYDEYNQTLESQVHPSDWESPQESRPYHLVVIGAGTAGLVTAAGAAGLGARVALVERELMGGDCLNVGCVPSKGIIRSGRAAAAVRDAHKFGVRTSSAEIDFAAAMERMRRLRAEISPADSAVRFRELGVDVYFGQARFESNGIVALQQNNGGHTQLRYRKAVIAAGARAAAPPIPGLASVNYLTNESLFSLTSCPPRLAVIGSGPIGAEMAQTFARLGSHVILLERSDRILPREDPEAAAVVQKQLERDGVELVLNAGQLAVAAGSGGSIRVSTRDHAGEHVREADSLLVAVGRAPNTDGLNLDSVGVEFTAKGIEVNDFLQTSNPHIYAAGDICSRYKFTHAADFMARIVIQNALFAVGPIGRKKVSSLVIPWATYTSPEVAHVGIQESDTIDGRLPDTYVQSFTHVDRAILEGQTEGFVKVHTHPGTDRIAGATVVAENAGDLISEITLAMTNGVGLGKLASVIHPYPTQAEAIRKLGDQFNRTRLTATSRRILNLLRRWNVGR